jgi:hypothetical protein
LDIDSWLREIGLAQYAETFRANDIDGELLGRLTSDDLKEIGVASFGHRTKLLEAIAELGNAPAAAPAMTLVMPPPISTVAPQKISAAVEATGERRYLTVMFCDLVGSTGISARLDADFLPAAPLSAAACSIKARTSEREDAVEDTAVIYSRYAAGLFGSNGLMANHSQSVSS